MPASRKPEPDSYFEDPISGIQRRIPPTPADAAGVAPSVHRNAPRLWVSVAALLFVVCASVGCVALAAGEYELALGCVGPVLVTGLLLLLAGEMGLST